MANADSVKEYTGFTIGGVSPVGLKKSLEIMIDKKLSRFQDLYAAAGHPNTIFRVNLENLIKLTKGTVMEISE